MALPVIAGDNRSDAEVGLGRRIYHDGLRANGEPLKGIRWDNVEVYGTQAACVLCHRPSGMGSVEGDIQAPPVTGNALFGEDKIVATMDPRSGKAFNRKHDPYTNESLARALREGRHVSGDAMSAMMPRYELSEREMQSLIAYLHQLSAEWSPGVSHDLIRFATAITPDVDAQRRTLFKEMMRKAVAQKNGSTAVAGRSGVAGRPRARRHMAGAAEFVLGTERNWFVDVWELQGAADTWAKQLDEFYQRQPVFALVSGLGADNWEPVNEFCDRQQVPCWFPSVDLPPANPPRYSIYFSRGVALEAQVLAAHLRQLGAKAPKRVVQVFRGDYVGAGGAHRLTAALADSGIVVQDRAIGGNDSLALTQALAGLGATDAVMFWLRPVDVARLESVALPAVPVYFSAQMSEAERGPLPAAWRLGARFVYPYELPERRQANLAYFKSWIKRRGIPLMDESMQSEVYFSLSFLTDTITEMLDNLYRDYLIERAETMISRRESSKVEAEFFSSTQGRLRQLPAPGQTGVAVTVLQQGGMGQGEREGTTAYPRLGLGPGQRFASKGGYIARFAAADGNALVAESDWIVP